MNQEKSRVLSPKELASLTERVLQMLPELNKYEELPGVPYDHPQARDLYQAAANGFLPGVPCPRLPEKSFACSDLPKLFENAHSVLAKTAALNVYKKAREAVHDEQFDEKMRDELFKTLEEIKIANRNYGIPHDVVGNCNDPNRWIYSYEDGPMVREVMIHSKKPRMKPLEIVQFSDAHFNYCNKKDFAEANPALLSTYEHRLWHANGDSADVVDLSFAYAAMSDQTILTGDLLDYEKNFRSISGKRDDLAGTRPVCHYYGFGRQLQRVRREPNDHNSGGSESISGIRQLFQWKDNHAPERYYPEC